MNQLIQKFIDIGYFSLDIKVHPDVRKKTKRKIIYIANHSGWVALDAAVWNYASDVSKVHTVRQAQPKVIVEDILFKIPFVDQFLYSCDCVPKETLKEGFALPKNVQHVAMFPEGSDGNCKSFLNAYQMQRWKPGFVKIAIANKALVYPSVLLGGEECLPSWMSIKATKTIFGSVSPWPIFLFPLPSKWSVSFLAPIDFAKYPKSMLNDRRAILNLTKELQKQHQGEIDRLAKDRLLYQIAKAKEKAVATFKLFRQKAS